MFQLLKIYFSKVNFSCKICNGVSDTMEHETRHCNDCTVPNLLYDGLKNMQVPLVIKNRLAILL